MRIVHVADVHLDRPFVGLGQGAGRRRRHELMQAFERVLGHAMSQDADALTIGGDLWEDENVTADTRASVAHELGRLGIPVLLVTGNHDPYLRGGVYDRTAWPGNVTIVKSASPAPVELAPDVVVWAASWTDRAPTLHPLPAIPRDGRVHIALFHGTARDARFAGEPGVHCPFDPAALRAAGFALTLTGHLHASSYRDGVVYPGSPEPLDHTETGGHCCAIVDVDAARVVVDLVAVNARRYVSRVIDCADAASSAEVEDRVRSGIADAEGQDVLLRVRLEGEVAADCAIDPPLLVARIEGSFAALDIEDRTTSAIDYAEIAERHSADGLFVAEMLDRIDAATDERERRVYELAMQAGVRAMRGEKEVLRVG